MRLEGRNLWMTVWIGFQMWILIFENKDNLVIVCGWTWRGSFKYTKINGKVTYFKGNFQIVQLLFITISLQLLGIKTIDNEGL